MILHISPKLGILVVSSGLIKKRLYHHVHVHVADEINENWSQTRRSIGSTRVPVRIERECAASCLRGGLRDDGEIGHDTFFKQAQRHELIFPATLPHVLR